MTLQEIGALLRQERERQNLALSDVVERTKISRSCIQAIEKGDSEGLPHPVYARGFIKNYATLLGLDGPKLAESFDRQYGLEEEGVVLESGDAAAEEVISKPEASRHSALAVGLISLSFFILLGGGWLIYDIYFSSPTVPISEPQPPLGQDESEGLEMESESASAPKPSVPGDGGDSSSSETGAAMDSEPVRAPGNATNASLQPVNSTVSPTNGQTNATPAVATNASSASSSQAQATPTPEVEEPEATSVDTAEQSGQNTAAPSAEVEDKVLQIAASEACWFRAEVDGSTRDVYLRPGETIPLHFDESLELRLGNAGGVSLMYNGESVAVDASSGEVKTLRFP